MKAFTKAVVLVILIFMPYTVLSVPDNSGMVYEEKSSNDKKATVRDKSDSSKRLEIYDEDSCNECKEKKEREKKEEEPEKEEEEEENDEELTLEPLPYIEDFIVLVTGQWNVWWLSVFYEIETTSNGSPFCVLPNYHGKCGTLTVAINQYESTDDLYIQVFGYSNGEGTLQIGYIVTIPSSEGMTIQMKFDMAKFLGQDGTEESVELTAEEISLLELELILLYADESTKELLIFVSEKPYDSGEHFVLVLLSETVYVSGSYTAYKDTITNILETHHVKCTHNREIELHSLDKEENCETCHEGEKKGHVRKGESKTVIEEEEEVTKEKPGKETEKETKQGHDEEETEKKTEQVPAEETKHRTKKTSEETTTKEGKKETEKQYTEETPEEEQEEQDNENEDEDGVHSTDKEACSEVTCLAKDQEYATKISNTWIVLRATRYAPSHDCRHCSVWNLGDHCASVIYTLQMEKKNKLIWKSYAYSTEDKAYHTLVKRVTTMTKSYAAYKDETLESLMIYEDGTEEDVPITDEDKALYSEYYALLFITDNYDIAVYATSVKINGKRYAWIVVTAEAHKSGSYKDYAEQIDEILSKNGVIVEDVVEMGTESVEIPECVGSIEKKTFETEVTESKTTKSKTTETKKKCSKCGKDCASGCDCGCCQ